MSQASSVKDAEKLLAAVLEDSRFKDIVYSVGGCVRDEILGIKPKDLDIVVEENGGAENLTKWLHKNFPDFITQPRQMGASYPIWQIVFLDNVNYNGVFYHIDGLEVEFSDTMTETFPDEKSRQRTTKFGTLKEDAERRDLTINSLYKKIVTGEIVDVTGYGIQDIKNKLIRVNPNVDQGFILSCDPLRMLRAIRFSVLYDFWLSKDLKLAIQRKADRIKIVSVERIMEELKKLGNVEQGFYRAVRFMDETDLLGHIVPEVEHLKFIKQQPDIREIHLESETVFGHTMAVLKNAKPTFEMQLAALLHDVGKNEETQEFIDGKIRFIHHEVVGARLAEKIMRRLKVDGKIIKKVKLLVEKHMIPHQLFKVTKKGLRRFLRDVGDDAEDIVALVVADSLGTLERRNGVVRPIPVDRYEGMLKTFEELRQENAKKRKLLDGRQIMDLLNIKEGKIVGEAVKIVNDIEDEYGFDVNLTFVKFALKRRFKGKNNWLSRFVDKLVYFLFFRTRKETA